MTGTVSNIVAWNYCSFETLEKWATIISKEN